MACFEVLHIWHDSSMCDSCNLHCQCVERLPSRRAWQKVSKDTMNCRCCCSGQEHDNSPRYCTWHRTRTCRCSCSACKSEGMRLLPCGNNMKTGYWAACHFMTTAERCTPACQTRQSVIGSNADAEQQQLLTWGSPSCCRHTASAIK